MTHQNIWLFILYQNLWPFLGSRCPCWRQWRKTCPKGWQIGPHAEFCRVAHHWNQNFVGYNIVRPKHGRKCHCGQQWRPVVPKLSPLGVKLKYKREGIGLFGSTYDSSTKESSVMTYCFRTWSLLTIVTNDYVQPARLSVIQGTLPCRVTYR